jgi:DNA-binding XRE family transcriptional regulator
MASVKAKRGRNKRGTITYQGRRGDTHTLHLAFKDRGRNFAPAALRDKKGWVSEALKLKFGPDLLRALVGGFVTGMDLRTDPGQEHGLAALLRDAAEQPNQLYATDLPVTSDPCIFDALQALASVIEDRGVGCINDPRLKQYWSLGQHLDNTEGHNFVASAGFYQDTRQAVALRRFEEQPGEPYPTATLRHGGSAKLVPFTSEEQDRYSDAEIARATEVVRNYSTQLSDWDVDVLDAICIAYLQRSPQQGERIHATVDELLRLLGAKPKPGGSGYAGGFTVAQRQSVAKAIARLERLWITVAEDPRHPNYKKGKGLRIESRMFVMTGQKVQGDFLDGDEEVFEVSLTPGDVLLPVLHGPGRQIMLQSEHALRYSRKKQLPEKRLTRYLSYTWRSDAKNLRRSRSFRVGTLLGQAGLSLEPQQPSKRPSKVRERLEGALDQLQKDGVVAGWEYVDWDEDLAGKQGWGDAWLNTNISIRVPSAIHQQNEKIKAGPTRRITQPETGPSYAVRVLEKRQAHGLDRATAAKAIGVSEPTLGRIERGETKAPKGKTRRALEAWLTN